MVTTTSKRKGFVKRDYSKIAPVNMAWGKNGPTVLPDFTFTNVLDEIDKDPLATGALNHFVDKCMEGDYGIVRREDRTYDWQAELRLEESYMFRTKILRKIFLLGKIYNNVFLEIVRYTDGKTKYLNVLDSANIEPVLNENGDPVKYVSRNIDKGTEKYVEWPADDIVWIKFGDRSRGFAPSDTKALYETLLIKRYIKTYVAWLWKTGQYRLIYNFEAASNQDINDFLAYARKNDEFFHIPFIVKGKLKTQLLRDMKETSSLVELLKYLDSQVLILLRVPPIDAGIPDASGRSNADAQASNIETSVMSMKKVVEDYINFDLFPKINKSTYLFQFGPMNRFAEQMVYTVAQTMASMNFKDEIIREFLLDKGLYYASEELFKEPEEMMLGGPANPRDKDNFESRKAKDEMTGNKPNEEGPTTREDQLHTR